MNSAAFTSHNILRRFFMVQTLLLILILNISSFTQTRYVSTSGSDFPNTIGDLEHPFRTVTYALSFKQLGQTLTIYVLGGEFHEYVEITTSGTGSNDQIIIQGVPGNIRGRTLEKPVFYGSDPNIFQGESAAFKWGSQQAHYVTLDNIIVENCTANSDMRGIWINGNNNLIKNCEVRNIIRSGIVIQGNNNTIEDNIVENIIGVQYNIRGNNISVETFWSESAARPSDNNVVQRNTLRNNPTHFGVNIFPNADDITQPVMFNNKIYSNFIDNTGGGIYTRYQRNLEIINNIIVNSTYSPEELWNTQGSAVTFDDKTGAPHPLPFNGGIIKIYNNTMVHNERSGIRNITSTGLKIFNNIFVDHAQSENYGHISFDQEFANTEIDYNLYNGTGKWKWGIQNKYNFIDWQNFFPLPDVKFDEKGLTANPLFETYQGIPYAIAYGSPAKNRGTYRPEVSIDKFGNSRPYWNHDYDIGAFEREDTQFKIGVTGVSSGTEVIHTLTLLGRYWERSSSGTWNLSSDQTLLTKSYTTTGNSVLNDLNSWQGWEYKWLDRNNSPEKRIAAGFYKLSNNRSNSYIYVDLRDAVTINSLNIYIHYNHTIGTRKYRYHRNGAWENYIDNGSVLRIWQIHGGNPNTSGLGTYYWANVLIPLEHPQHPRMVWGPVSGQSTYSVFHRLGVTFNWSLVESLNNLYEYTDNSRLLVQPPNAGHIEDYRVMQNNQYSNIVGFEFPGDALDKTAALGTISYNYNISQNYPNPFNPVTTIKFSIANEDRVILKVYDILGREVRTLIDKDMNPGEYQVEFNSGDLASGVYVYRITSGAYTQVKTMQLLK